MICRRSARLLFLLTASRQRCAQSKRRHLRHVQRRLKTNMSAWATVPCVPCRTRKATPCKSPPASAPRGVILSGQNYCGASLSLSLSLSLGVLPAFLRQEGLRQDFRQGGGPNGVRPQTLFLRSSRSAALGRAAGPLARRPGHGSSPSKHRASERARARARARVSHVSCPCPFSAALWLGPRARR